MYRQLGIIVNQAANQISNTSHVYSNAGYECILSIQWQHFVHTNITKWKKKKYSSETKSSCCFSKLQSRVLLDIYLRLSTQSPTSQSTRKIQLAVIYNCWTVLGPNSMACFEPRSVEWEESSFTTTPSAKLPTLKGGWAVWVWWTKS